MITDLLIYIEILFYSNNFWQEKNIKILIIKKIKKLF